MRHEKYKVDFEALYPNYGAPPLMEKFGLTRRYVTNIASSLKVRRLPRDQRICWSCPEPLVDVPAYTGNYCGDCFNRRRKEQIKVPVYYLRSLFHRARNRAKKKGVEFNLTQRHLLDLWERQEQRCFYSRIEMSMEGRRRNPYGVSLDRVIPNKGYIIGNVVLCCWGVNTAKQEFTLAEFLFLCRKVTENSRNQKFKNLNFTETTTV